MNSVVTRRLLLLGLVSGVVAYPAQFYLPDEEQDQGYQTKVVCFVSASNEDYDYANLSPGMCTHFILIDLIGLNAEGRLLLLQRSSRALSLFLDLRRRLLELGDTASFMLAVGGVNQKSTHFSQAISEPAKLYTVVDNIVSFVTKHGFDGVDIAWFYPGQFGGRACDKGNLVVLLQELQLRLRACAMGLSVTVGVDPKDIDISYDVPKIDEYVDFVNFLTGDYHDPRKPSHVSPLYPCDTKDRLNIQYSVKTYIQAGLNPQKIVILLSTYAYLYTMKIPAKGGQAILKNVQKLSKLSAQEIIERENFLISWDDARFVPYASWTQGTNKKWITFNDLESHRKKAAFVLDHQLGGIGAFSIDQDDYQGYANLGPYPFLWAVVDILRPESKYIDFSVPVQLVPSDACPYSGNVSDPSCPNCFVECQAGAAIADCPRRSCPEGTVYDPAQDVCYQPAPCGCPTGSGSPTTSTTACTTAVAPSSTTVAESSSTASGTTEPETTTTQATTTTTTATSVAPP
ncbi:hypothetical protein quinque_004876 [Culex quinquefasciatus]